MRQELLPKWLTNDNGGLFLKRAEQSLTVVTQPIVALATGKLIALEFLVRGVEKLGYDNPEQLFDHAAAIHALAPLETILHRKSLSAFKRPGYGSDVLAFINLDGRTITQAPDYPTVLRRLAQQAGVEPNSICVELSEANQDKSKFGQTAGYLRDASFRLAIDDFGSGYAGLQMLYEVSPDYLKMDRFFIQRLDRDAKKRLFVSSIVDLSHTLGITVIGEGVETAEELQMCRNIRCDLAQGYFVARPFAGPSASMFPHVAAIRHEGLHRTDIVKDYVERLVPVTEEASLSVLYEVFEKNPDQSVVPVLDKRRQPVGVICETAIKPFIYSPFGRELLSNKTLGLKLSDLVISAPSAEVGLKPSDLLHLHPNVDQGLVITEGMQYAGFLPSSAISRIVNELQIGEARTQNHLTHLPGSEAVQTAIRDTLDLQSGIRWFAYLDIDSFKPFNDRYGFRLGDRAILLFADLLKRRPVPARIGHIGGDDFFACGVRDDVDEVITWLKDLRSRFSYEAASLYSSEDRKAGWISGQHRDGRAGQFPLMSASVGFLSLSAGVTSTVDGVADHLADAKKSAKAASSGWAQVHLAASELLVPGVENQFLDVA